MEWLLWPKSVEGLLFNIIITRSWSERMEGGALLGLPWIIYCFLCVRSKHEFRNTVRIWCTCQTLLTGPYNYGKIKIKKCMDKDKFILEKIFLSVENACVWHTRRLVLCWVTRVWQASVAYLHGNIKRNSLQAYLLNFVTVLEIVYLIYLRYTLLFCQFNAYNN